MFTVEDDRQTSVSDPAPRTSSIEEVTLGNAFPDIKSVAHPAPPFPQHVGPTIKAPSVHITQPEDPVPNPPSTGPRIRWDNIPTRAREEEDPRHVPLREDQDNAAQLRAIDTWLAARPRIAAVRIQILTYRVDVKRERDGYSRIESLIETVLDQFMEVLGTAGATGSYMSSWQHLEQLRDKLRVCRDDLTRQREKLAAVEDALSNQEYKLTELEQDLYEDLDREYLSGPSSQPHAGATLNTPPTTTSAGHTSHSARQELYSRMGDLRILLDRLNEFEGDIRQELDDRDLSRAQGEIGITPDEEFFEEHRNKRKQMQTEVDHVQAEVSRLKQLCDSQKIPYEDVQFPEPLYEASNSGLSTTSAKLPEAQVPEPTASQRSGSSSVIKTFMNSRDRVKKWLGDPLNPAEVGRPIAEEHEVEPLSSPPGPDTISSTRTIGLSPSTIQDVRTSLQIAPPWVLAGPPDSFVSDPAERRHRRASDTAI